MSRPKVAFRRHSSPYQSRDNPGNWPSFNLRQSIPLHPSVIPHHPADSQPSVLAARLRRSCAMQSLILCSANLWIGQGETSTEGRLGT